MEAAEVTTVAVWEAAAAQRQHESKVMGGRRFKARISQLTARIPLYGYGDSVSSPLARPLVSS